jgi:hypothetical protein
MPPVVYFHRMYEKNDQAYNFYQNIIIHIESLHDNFVNLWTDYVLSTEKTH